GLWRGFGLDGRDATATNDGRRVVIPPLMLIMAVGLVPLGRWMMIRRPEQNWERELRHEHERSPRWRRRPRAPTPAAGSPSRAGGYAAPRKSRSGRPSLLHSARLIRHPIDEGAVADVTAVPPRRRT